MIKKIRLLYFFIISFLCSTHIAQTENHLRKELSADDIKKLATEIFNEYIETIKKIRSTKEPLNTKTILISTSTFIITLAGSMWLGNKAIHTNFSDLIRNLFTFKNSLKIDESKKNYLLPSFLDGVEFNNNQDKFFLFYGPPGTGKSFAASVLAAKKKCFYKETDGNIFNVETYVGTDIKKINAFFNEIQELGSKNPKQKKSPS